MRKSSMPEVKFQRREREALTDAEIIAKLRQENMQLEKAVDDLREVVNDRDALIAELRKEIERLSASLR